MSGPHYWGAEPRRRRSQTRVADSNFQTDAKRHSEFAATAKERYSKLEGAGSGASLAMLFTFFGHPGAGKTTLARRFAELHGCIDVDTDHFMTAEELRVKESDRIATTVAMLRAFGIACDDRPDGFSIEGRPDRPLDPGRVHADGDHRIAMAAAVAGLVASGPTVVDDADNVATSYPGFAAALSKLGASVNTQ